jgi:hypothetical protein
VQLVVREETWSDSRKSGSHRIVGSEKQAQTVRDARVALNLLAWARRWMGWTPLAVDGPGAGGAGVLEMAGTLTAAALNERPLSGSVDTVLVAPRVA